MTKKNCCVAVELFGFYTPTNFRNIPLIKGKNGVIHRTIRVLRPVRSQGQFLMVSISVSQLFVSSISLVSYGPRPT